MSLCEFMHMLACMCMYMCVYICVCMPIKYLSLNFEVVLGILPLKVFKSYNKHMCALKLPR